MKIVKIKFEKADGSIYYVDNQQDIENIIAGLPKQLAFKKTTDKETLQQKYFAMLTELAKNGETGYTKMELHSLLKPLLFKEIKSFPHLYETNQPEISTKHLNVEGWSTLIEQLRSTANDIFNGYVFEN